MKVYKFVVQSENDKERLDILLSKREEIPSSSFAQNLINKGLILVDGKIVNKNYPAKAGQEIEVRIEETEELNLKPETIPIKIIYEDENLIVVSKPSGMVVHPSFGHSSGTLVNAVLAHCEIAEVSEDKIRPGVVHRLDKDTSGLLLIAKDNKTHLALSDQLERREIKRRYIGLVVDIIKEDSGTIDAPIGRGFKNFKKMTIAGRASREAITHFEVLKRYNKYTLLKLILETGRTHQIRVHMAYIKHPIVGDKEYGGRRSGADLGLKRQFLHAKELEFIHPVTGEKICLSDNLPDDLMEALKKLGETNESGIGF
ncbi:MAG: RluA family pseudouridine synthase [Actinobacteria bacterium]|nr:RluA family pseudouridine synthase [Actinomycetota bacterium]